jgi:hypothetical protein
MLQELSPDLELTPEDLEYTIHLEDREGMYDVLFKLNRLIVS